MYYIVLLVAVFFTYKLITWNKCEKCHSLFKMKKIFDGPDEKIPTLYARHRKIKRVNYQCKKCGHTQVKYIVHGHY